MNRKKKINSILKKKAKRAAAKTSTNKKPKYIPKGEREQQQVDAQPDSEAGADSSPSE
ncbi:MULTISPECIES: DUF2986 domain-containing protein [Ferrimonas]|uniref:DUF2986 domain-containing protein n=1 Tax=Ferrimonas TaxID=44011 RepID=UPI0003F53C0C|nr:MULTISPECIES: DUF2986 domain-containing protein [Ferrimonas]USD39070.1 DUF2986 domain-containing protein [Ferrimonas sp. SCSIO 43195]